MPAPFVIASLLGSKHAFGCELTNGFPFRGTLLPHQGDQREKVVVFEALAWTCAWTCLSGQFSVNQATNVVMNLCKFDKRLKPNSGLVQLRPSGFNELRRLRLQSFGVQSYNGGIDRGLAIA